MRSIDSLFAAKYRQSGWSAFLLEDEEDGGDDDDVLHLSNHLWYDVNGDGEDDGAVVLRGDAVQRLKVSQLKIKRWIIGFLDLLENLIIIICMILSI